MLKVSEYTLLLQSFGNGAISFFFRYLQPALKRDRRSNCLSGTKRHLLFSPQQLIAIVD